ncbi:MAG: SpoIIE family protein phosphatase [Leptospiraceae bacterium]|nr:SpoIIE family protein phosphatase [Leptospiraceae bacterium]
MEISNSDLKDIKSARPTNISRIASSIIFIILYSLYDYNFVLYLAIIQFVLSIIWLWVIEKKFSLYKRKPNLWYIPASIDVFFATSSVYITGISYSPVLLAYILITCMSSTDLIKARGLFTTISSCVGFLFILLLVSFEIIPFVNILSENNSSMSLFSIILSSFLLILSCFTANSVIYQIYWELNKKNNELNFSLNKILILKQQQDADYALTARLMEPFGSNTVNSPSVNIEFFLKQKKSFTFKNHDLEIGGDLLISDELYFNNKKFIFFLNADAMGKSMQGACGALVLGVLIKSMVLNSKNQIHIDNQSAKLWLLNVTAEIHRIFESFEGSMLASFIIGLLEEKTGQVFYINAEHPEPILYRDETVSFIESKYKYTKIGTLELQQNFDNIEFLQLEINDVLFIGSDGKDDILLNENLKKIINEDEYFFSRIVRKSKGDINLIVKEIISLGDLIDDLSILKISFRPTYKL